MKHEERYGPRHRIARVLPLGGGRSRPRDDPGHGGRHVPEAPPGEHVADQVHQLPQERRQAHVGPDGHVLRQRLGQQRDRNGPARAVRLLRRQALHGLLRKAQGLPLLEVGAPIPPVAPPTTHTNFHQNRQLNGAEGQANKPDAHHLCF